MYIIHDDGTFEIVRGDTAEFGIVPQVFEEVESPIIEDIDMYYEIVDGSFVKTKDRTIVNGKTYYELSEYTLQEGDTLTFTVKKNTKTSDIIFQKHGPTVKIEAEDTEGVSYGKYLYDVEFANSDRSKVDTIIEPTEFKVLEEVTF